MKGFAMQYVFIIFIIILSLVISFLIIFSFFKPSSPGYMGLPEGIWYSISSANTTTFVLPPVLWFGNNLTLGSYWVDYSKIFSSNDPREFIFPTNSIYLKEFCFLSGITCVPHTTNFDYLGLLITSFFNPTNLFSILSGGTYKFTFDVYKVEHPTLAFYPFATPNLNILRANSPAEFNSTLNLYLLNLNKEFGKVNLTFRLDLDKLSDYYYKKGYNFEKRRIDVRLGVKYGTDITKETYLFENKTKTLEELVLTGNCSGSYVCSFKFNIVKRCCPSYAKIQPIIIVNLTKDGTLLYRREELQPTIFTIVYYVDNLTNLDNIFDQFDKIFSGVEEEINIYPCRAIIVPEKRPFLQNLKGLGGLDIYWDSCNSIRYGQLKYKNINQNSTWYCKEISGNYRLYNPYGFCKLESDKISNKLKLPEIPKITYLQQVIPSGKLTKKLPGLTIPYWWGAWYKLHIVPETTYGSYRESASTMAAYVISKSLEALYENKNSIILFDHISAGSITINYIFR